MRLVSSGNVNS